MFKDLVRITTLMKFKWEPKTYVFMKNKTKYNVIDKKYGFSANGSVIPLNLIAPIITVADDILK